MQEKQDTTSRRPLLEKIVADGRNTSVLGNAAGLVDKLEGLLGACVSLPT